MATFAGRTALVTGAGTGIGAVTAELLAAIKQRRRYAANVGSALPGVKSSVPFGVPIVSPFQIGRKTTVPVLETTRLNSLTLMSRLTEHGTGACMPEGACTCSPPAWWVTTARSDAHPGPVAPPI